MSGTFKKGLIALVVLVAGVFFLVMFYGSSIVSSSVEKYGPDYTKTSVTLDDVSFSPVGGKVGLSGLTVGSPEGFDAEKIFSFSDVKVTLDSGSLFSDVVEIQEVRITDPELVVEYKNGKLNFNALMENLEEYVPAESESSETNVAIKDFYITGGKVTVIGLPLSEDGSSMVLPDLHIEDIGWVDGQPQGTTFAKATGVVMSAVTSSVTNVIAQNNIKDLLGGKKSIKDKIKGFFGGGNDDDDEEGEN